MAGKAARRFGWDWWVFNLSIAAIPPGILWYSLAQTKHKMQEDVVKLKDAIQMEKDAKEQQAQVGQAGSSTAPPPPTASTDERLRHLEAKLEELERTLKGKLPIPRSPSSSFSSSSAAPASEKNGGRRGDGNSRTQQPQQRQHSASQSAIGETTTTSTAPARSSTQTNMNETGIQRRILEQYTPDVLKAFEKLRRGGVEDDSRKEG